MYLVYLFAHEWSQQQKHENLLRQGSGAFVLRMCISSEIESATWKEYRSGTRENSYCVFFSLDKTNPYCVSNTNWQSAAYRLCVLSLSFFFIFSCMLESLPSSLLCLCFFYRSPFALVDSHFFPVHFACFLLAKLVRRLERACSVVVLHPSPMVTGAWASRRPD